MVRPPLRTDGSEILNGGIPCRLFGSHEVAGISPTHGFLEAIIVVGDVDKAAL